MKKYESNIWGIVAAIVVMLLLFLFLWFYYLDRPFVPEEEGIEVVFGDGEEGGSEVDEPSTPAPPSVATPVPPTPSAPSSNDLIVQNDEESLELQKQAEEKKRKKQELDDQRKQKQEEDARVKAEQDRIAKEKALAEAAAKAAAEKAAAEKAAAEAAKTAKAQGLMAGAFGSGGSGSNTGSGSGNATGDSAKGNPVGAGSGSVNGAKWSLAGRDVKSLPKPSNQFNQEGTVVVQITADANGKVISAKATGGTVSDETTRKLAEEAAKKAVFSSGKNNVQGTITYTFKFT